VIALADRIRHTSTYDTKTATAAQLARASTPAAARHRPTLRLHGATFPLETALKLDKGQ